MTEPNNGNIASMINAAVNKMADNTAQLEHEIQRLREQLEGEAMARRELEQLVAKIASLVREH